MSETLAHPTLSGDTRQCACGGWTRFVVCQYCGTTDPAVAAAGWVSSSPLTVPTAFDPAAVPPPALPSQLPPPVPAPLVAQHDSSVMATPAMATPAMATPAMATPAMATPAMAATSAFADLHAPAAPPMAAAAPLFPPAPVDTVPAAPQALSAPPAPAPHAPAGYPPPEPPTALAPPAVPPAPAAFAPAGDPGASLVGAGAVGTYPAPLPVPPGAAWPHGDAPAAPAPAPTPLPVDQHLTEAAAPAATPKAKGPRPRWVAPAAGVALVGSAAAAYVVWFGGGGSGGDSKVALPPVHHAPQLTPALLTGTLPAGYTAKGAPVAQKVAQILPGQTAGHPTTGATAAESLSASSAKGAVVSALALQFPTPGAATAFARAKDAAGVRGHQVFAFSTRGVFAFAVETDAPKDAAATAAVAAWARSLGA